MAEPGVVVHIDPVLVDRTTAAAMMGMSLDSFERYVQPELRIVRRGRLRLVPVDELKRWGQTNAEALFLADGTGRTALRRAVMGTRVGPVVTRTWPAILTRKEVCHLMLELGFDHEEMIALSSRVLSLVNSHPDPRSFPKWRVLEAAYRAMPMGAGVV